MLLALPATAQSPRIETAYLAGGCFWCVEADFEKLPGVLDAVSGYMGGHLPHPTYDQVAAGSTGHAEVVRIRYDARQLSYADILAHFWRNIDPTVANRQFCDVGSQYRSAIFHIDEGQERLALESRKALLDSARFPSIHTEIRPAQTFYPAEEYHQDYYRKNPVRYRWYRGGCGRDERLRQLWGKEAGGT